jgi:hypothetical protein
MGGIVYCGAHHSRFAGIEINIHYEGTYQE